MGMPTPPPMDKESAELSEELREPEADRANEEADRQEETEKDNPSDAKDEEDGTGA